MPMEFLRELAHGDRFPVVVDDEADIDKLRVLRAAGMVEAQLPDSPHQPAYIVAITGLGRATLRAQVARQVIALRQRLLADKRQLA
ncbi:MAG: hypothetical protein EOO33_01465 [Comamonadaceae bacterium]|nr:MAG: hypothetical protein EOO33_01465 [Comamonadaceae bacterium]